jgi:hypothetical protein
MQQAGAESDAAEDKFDRQQGRGRLVPQAVLSTIVPLALLNPNG